MHPRQNPVKFDLDPKNKSFSTATQRQNECRPTTLKLYVIFDNPHNNQINLILHWNKVKFDSPNRNEVNLDHPYKVQVNFHAHIKNK